MYRERSGRTQDAIAGLAGISRDYLGQVERGRKNPSTAVVQALADALRVTAGELLGGTAHSTSVAAPVSGDRLALALLSGGGAVVDPQELADRTAAAWSTWQSSGHRFTELLPGLPDLIRDTEATRRAGRHSPYQRQIAATASDLYGLLRTVTRRVGRGDLSFLVADRGVTAAEDADDPIRIAAAQWNLGHTLLLSGEHEAAIELVAQASAAVMTAAGCTPAALAMTGALELVAAVAEARSGRLWEARDRLHEVGPLAVQARTASNVGHTMFGTLNVGLHAIAIELQAGDALEALRIAEHLDTSGCPSVERRFTFALDLARAYELRRQETGTLLHLLDAEHVSPEDMRYNPAGHDMVARLMTRGSRATIRAQAAKLAHRLDLPADAVR
ncbi:helix-turn-helix transcriptional regulator [Nocardia heshunensis]